MISWGDDTNERLKSECGISFELAAAEIETGRVLAVVPSPTHEDQQIYVIRLGGYVSTFLLSLTRKAISS